MTQSRAAVLGRRYLQMVVLWVPLTCVIFTAAFNDFEGDLVRSFLQSMIISETTALLCFWGSVAVVEIQRRIYARRGWVLEVRSPTGNFFWKGGFVFMFPGMALGFHLAGRVSAAYGWKWGEVEWRDYRLGTVIGILVGAFMSIFEMRREAKLARERAEQRIQAAENAGMRAKISALTAQMNPHLLFNALNSIAAMIPDQPDDAEAMTVELSKLYRRVLAAARAEVHPLADELELVRSYLRIERARFEERVRFEIVVAPEVDASGVRIPVLCLQPFVENAVKHGLLGRGAGGTVWVRAEAAGGELLLEVEDDGVGFGKAGPSSGSGTALANCAERLRLLFGGAAGIEIAARAPSGTLVRVRMPAAGYVERAGATERTDA